MIYLYRGYNQRGEAVNGTIAGDTYGDVLQSLHSARHYTITTLEPLTRAVEDAPIRALVSKLRRNKAKLDQGRLEFYRILRRHIRRAGNHSDAIATAAEVARSDEMAAALRDMLVLMEVEGKTVSQAMEQHPNVFPREHVAQVRSGEEQTTRMLSALDALIEEEQGEKSQRQTKIIERFDSYATYVGVIITVLVLGKFFLPQNDKVNGEVGLSVAQQHSWSFVVLKFFGTMSVVISNPLAWVLVLGFGILLKWTYEHFRNSPATAEAMERLEWTIPTKRDSDLEADRERALSVIISGRRGALDPSQSLSTAAEVVRGAYFARTLREMAHRVSVQGRVLELEIAEEPLFGAEIQTFFRGLKDATWADDAKELLRDIAEEVRVKRRRAALAGNVFHALVALAATSVIIVVLTMVQIAQFLAFGGSQ